MLVELQADDQVQGELDLFSGLDASAEPAAPRDASKLMGALDALNQRFGKGAVTVASAMRQEPTNSAGGAVQSRQEWRSPRYTTRLAEIPSARA
jgi:DNA polymerase V